MDILHQVFYNPDWAYLLLIIGMLGLLFEVTNPGVSFPGIVGVASLIGSIYLLSYFPIDYTGIGLITLAFILLILEVKVISCGGLAILGTTAFAFGSFYLIKGDLGMQISPSLIITSSIVLFAFSILLLYLGLKVQKTKRKTGFESLIGAKGIVSQQITPEKIGEIKILGERWRAKSVSYCDVNQEVEVLSMDNLTLFVKNK